MRLPRLTLLLPAGLTLGAVAALPLLPASAAPAQDLTISSVRVDTTVDPYPSTSGGDIRQRTQCEVLVDFDDAAARTSTDGYYELRTPGSEYGLSRRYLYEEGDPTSLSTYGCWMFTPGEAAELTVHYVEYDEDAGRNGDYVDRASSAPVEFTLEEVGHPTAARVGGPGVSRDVMETGTEAVISFTGSWAEDAVVTAKVTTTEGWTGIDKQDTHEREVPTTWDPASQTFTFVPDRSLAGRTVYVTVKGAAPGGDQAAWLYTWSPKILVARDARATRRSWVDSFGTIDRKRSSLFLATTKARATRAGERAGVRFVYQGWWGEDTYYAWHSSSRSSAVGEFGGCPVVEQHVRVLALVPGRLPVGHTITMAPPGCRAVPDAPALAATAAPGGWG